MKRSGPLKRSTTPIKRTAKLKARGRSRFPKRRDPAYLAWIREEPCVLAGWRHPLAPEDWGSQWYHVCNGKTVPAHVKSRGAGAYDLGDVIPLCSGAHNVQHSIGIKSWQATWKIDAAKLAVEYARRYLEQQNALR